jgi:hypothetical protein
LLPPAHGWRWRRPATGPKARAGGQPVTVRRSRTS